MKIALKIVLFLSIIIFSLFGIVLFRDVPAVKIWDNYRIFYVDKDLSIFDALSNIDTTGVISKESQEYVKPNNYTPIIFLLMIYEMFFSLTWKININYFMWKNLLLNLLKMN